MKILTVGAGAQGLVIASELVKDPEVDQVRLADIDLEKARRLARELKSEKIRTHRVDASKPDDLLKVAKGVDVIVNSTVPKYNLTIMNAALKSGACYQDLASNYVTETLPFSVNQLNVSDKWRNTGLTALIDTGVSPGITNVLARHAADRLDRVDQIRIRLFYELESTEIISMWAPKIAWDDMAEEPIVFKDGEFSRVPPFGGEEVYTFPEPVGSQTVVWHAHEEAITLPLFIGKGVRYVDVKMGGGWWPNMPLAVTKAIVQIGLMNDKPIEIKGAKIVPREVLFTLTPPTPSMEEVESKIKAGIIADSHGSIVVEVDGEKAGKKTNHTLYIESPSIREAQKKLPGATDLSYMTGVPASIFTRMLGKGEIKAEGVIPPECLGPRVREAFLAELAEKDIIIHERVKRRLA